MCVCVCMHVSVCVHACVFIILYFAWEDQSDATYRIVHTVMQLIGQIQYTWANTVQLCGEFI